MDRTALTGFFEALQRDEALGVRFSRMAETLPAGSDPAEAVAAFAQANGHALTAAELDQLRMTARPAGSGGADAGSLSDGELEGVSGGAFGNGTFLIDPNGAVGGAIGNAANSAFSWFNKIMSGR
ncbi:MAG: hypothetical protein ACK4ZN_12355 [Oceanibaculum sp.]